MLGEYHKASSPVYENFLLADAEGMVASLFAPMIKQTMAGEVCVSLSSRNRRTQAAPWWGLQPLFSTKMDYSSEWWELLWN